MNTSMRPVSGIAGSHPSAAVTLAVSLGLAALLAFAGWPNSASAQVERAGNAIVRGVVDGDTVILDDRSQVRLVGLQAPKLPLGRPNYPKWPLADEAKEALRALALGRRVTLAFGGRRSDRYGRHLAHLYRADGLWIQGEMLKRGLARVYSFRDNRALVPEMLALEREARVAGRGIWAHPFYRIRRIEETPRHIDSFQLVEGRVLKATRVGRYGFLNFGMDWRSDFTISVGGAARRMLAKKGFEFAALEGRLIRVRGWLKLRNGPMIVLTHPEQIEVLDE